MKARKRKQVIFLQPYQVILMKITSFFDKFG